MHCVLLKQGTRVIENTKWPRLLLTYLEEHCLNWSIKTEECLCAVVYPFGSEQYLPTWNVSKLFSIALWLLVVCFSFKGNLQPSSCYSSISSLSFTHPSLIYYCFIWYPAPWLKLTKVICCVHFAHVQGVETGGVFYMLLASSHLEHAKLEGRPIG